MTLSASEPPSCHVCATPNPRPIPGYERLARVTSDCKVWPPGGHLVFCPNCGCAQAGLDAQWHKDADAIYAAYSIYHQSQGAEQNVFDSVSGQPSSRSGVLVRRLKDASLLPARGRMMDFGCGNGSLLKSFGPVFAEWKLNGLELSAERKKEIESIAGVERLFTPPLDAVPGEFDLITLIHCLEHIAAPLNFLGQIRPKLRPSGLVLVQVPDCGANPFSLLIADHATHFCLETLSALAQRGGFEILLATNQWVAKELTVIGRKVQAAPSSDSASPISLDEGLLNSSVAWLDRLADEARRLSNRKPFGLFGSSIAATFLAGELGDAVDFFVDEDPNRQGKVWCGRPIYAPSRLPAGAGVFVGLPPVVAARILERMHRLNLSAQFYPPPPLPVSAES